MVVAGVILSSWVIYYWIPVSYIHWTFLFVGVGAIISGIFYETSIQLYHKNNLLIVEYVSKGKFEFNGIGSFELNNGVLKIHSEGRRVEVYNVKMNEENSSKLLRYLKDFQISSGTNANNTNEWMGF